jgi:hypothetical protein
MKTLPVKHNPETDEYFIELPDDMLESAGFKIGDTLVWTDLGDKSWSLTKQKSNDPLFLVETISVFRMRYVVQGKSAEHAEDSVVMNDIKDDMSQKHLDETIVSTRQIDEKEYLRIFDEDNDYLKSWTDEKKLSMIHKIKYDNQ